MNPPVSMLIDGTKVPPGAHAGVFYVYGEPDDPLRLLVLLANHVADLLGTDAGPCLDRRAPWRARRDGLAGLFDELRRHDHAYVVLSDLDALAPTSRDDWDDPGSHRMREDMFDLVCRAVDRGGWVVLRPSPIARVSKRISGIAAIEETDAGPIADPNTLAFSPDVRPIAQWLVQSGQLRTRDLRHITESVNDPDEHIIAIGYDSLLHEQRVVARRIQILRPPSPINGTFGPLPWGVANRFGVPREAIDALRARGFLQSAEDRSSAPVRMPRRIRELVGSHLPYLDGEWAIAAHQWIAQRGLDTSPEQLIEAHYHAARSGSIELTKQTARYYGYELRSLATQASRDRQDFAGAAELFRYLVDEYDATDAYTWEYLGYNLARWDAKDRARGRHRDQILDAYQRAFRLDRSNPLYHGRWLGYRAEIGHDVDDHFDRAIAKYLREYGVQEDAVSRFTMPVLDGLRRANRVEDHRRALTRWRQALEKYAPNVVARHAE
jgi:hypothetical protein